MSAKENTQTISHPADREPPDELVTTEFAFLRHEDRKT